MGKRSMIRPITSQVLVTLEWSTFWGPLEKSLKEMDRMRVIVKNDYSKKMNPLNKI